MEHRKTSILAFALALQTKIAETTRLNKVTVHGEIKIRFHGTGFIPPPMRISR